MKFDADNVDWWMYIQRAVVVFNKCWLCYDSSCIFFLVILVFSKVEDEVLCALVLFVERNMAKMPRYWTKLGSKAWFLWREMWPFTRCVPAIAAVSLFRTSKQIAIEIFNKIMTWNTKIISLWWGEFLLRYFNNSVLQCSHPQLICKTHKNNKQARLFALRISCISPAVHLSTSEKRCRT